MTAGEWIAVLFLLSLAVLPVIGLLLFAFMTSLLNDQTNDQNHPNNP